MGTISPNTWLVSEAVPSGHGDDVRLRIIGAFDTRREALGFMESRDPTAELRLGKVDPVVARVPFEWVIKAPEEGDGMLGQHGGDNQAATRQAEATGQELRMLLDPHWSPRRADRG